MRDQCLAVTYRLAHRLGKVSRRDGDGGIHLRRDINGTVFKETADDHNLLEKFKEPSASVTPLLVSEGTAEDKYQAIARSPYLSFGLASLSDHSGGLVIFGSSLRDEDKHLI
jgi:Domain of unknown function (DUF4917)